MAVTSTFLEVLTKVNLIDAAPNIGRLYFEKIFSLKDHSLSLKRLVHWDRFADSYGFSKATFYREREKPRGFHIMTFNIIICYMWADNSTKIH